MLTAERVSALEAAVIALGAQVLEFGDHKGHKFRGNQYKDEGGERDEDNSERMLKSILKNATSWKPELEATSRLFNTLFDPTKEQRKMMKNAAFARVETLELAVLSLAQLELGDRLGHDFRGNQWGPHSSGVSLKTSSDVRGELEHVMKNGQKLGKVQRLHEFLEDKPGNGRGFEGHPVVGEKKEFDTKDEAVRHVLEQTKAIHSPESEEDAKYWAEWENRKNGGWKTGVGVAASG